MQKTRSELRNIIMTILYQLEIYEERNMDYRVEEIIKDNIEIESDFVNSVVNGVRSNLVLLDTLANKYMNNWTIDRIDKLGANILRIALYELKYTDTPDVVVINEAIELSKKYCDDSVRKIINAVLDKVIRA